jgi:type I restriction enzyme M protein
MARTGKSLTKKHANKNPSKNKKPSRKPQSLSAANTTTTPISPSIQPSASFSPELLDRVFRDSPDKQSLRFFTKGERTKISLRGVDDKIEIYCAKRNRWLRAKPEEVIRQLFLVWIQETLKYSLQRISVEWPIQMGQDSEKERADIVIFTDDACTDPYIVFELKRPNSKEGLEQLRSYLRWTGCFFGCWSNGSDHSYQLKEEEKQTRKGPYAFRDIGRLPKLGQDLADILKPLTFAELTPIADMRGLIERLEHDALANAGVNSFDELFKLFFAKLHDEFKPKKKKSDPVEFRLPVGSPDVIYDRFNKLFQAAKSRPHWNEIFDEGDVLKLRGEALKLCAAALEPYSLADTDLDAVDAAFEYLVNPEQKGQKGQYFTPRPVVKMAVKMLNPQDGEKVIDPACGSCGFLIHTIRHVQKQYGWSTAQIYRYANDYLYAVDFDERLKKVAKTMMIIAGDGKANVFGVSSLDVREWQNSEASAKIGEFSKETRDGSFDIVLTNPPFAGKITGKTQLMAFDLYELASTGALAEDDEDDLEEEGDETQEKPKKSKKVKGLRRDILFVERCLDLLKPGGRIAIVLPQGNLNNLGTRALRAYVAERARLLAVIGLHVNTFKPFTGTKTSLVILQKWGGSAGARLDNYPVFMATSQRSGKRNNGEYQHKTDSQGNQVDENNVPVTESGRPPAIDHDLNEIAEAFLRWGADMGLEFIVES